MSTSAAQNTMTGRLGLETHGDVHHMNTREPYNSHMYQIGKVTQGDYAQMYNGNISGNINNYFGITENPDELIGKIHLWLKAPDHKFEHQEARKKHEVGTGQWFLDHEIYRSWLDGEGQTLWIHGKPGCCKTILCSTVIGDLQTLSSGVPVIYFYFTFRETRKQQYQGLLLSLISQFLDIDGVNITPELKSIYERSRRHPESLQAALDSLIRVHRIAFLVVDAVDECSEDNDHNQRDEVLCGLKKLAKTHPSLKLFLSSRKESGIDDSIQSWATPVVDIEVKPSNQDMIKYVSMQLERDVKLRQLSSSTKEDIVENLALNANGMFRWVYCSLDHVSRRPLLTTNHVAQALRDLPRTLDETYERILKQFVDCQEVHTALRWLAFSESNLTMHELREACITNHNEEPFVDEGSRPAIENLLRSLSALVRIGVTDYKRDPYVSAIGLGQSHEEGVYVQLAHFSVKEFLVSERIKSSPVAQFSLESMHSYHLIAQDCVAYLLHCTQAQVQYHDRTNLDTANTYTCELDKGRIATSRYCRRSCIKSQVSDWLSELYTSYPLLETACMWAHYQQSAEEGHVCHVCSPLQDRFLESRATMRFYFEVLSDLGLGVIPSSILHLAAKVDYVSLGRKNDFDVELLSKSSPGRKLIFASAAGFLNTVAASFLPTRQTRLTPTDLGCALILASSNGKGNNTRIIQSLLTGGADVNCCCYDERGHTVTALTLACEDLAYELAQLLLENNADPNQLVRNKITVLRLACSRANARTMVAMLLRHGANPDGVPEDQHPPVFMLADSLSTREVEGSLLGMLLGAGGDPNARSRANGMPALIQAARTLSLEAMKILLQAGANPNILDRGNFTAVDHVLDAMRMGPYYPLRHAHGKDAVMILLAAGANLSLMRTPHIYCDRELAWNIAYQHGRDVYYSVELLRTEYLFLDSTDAACYEAINVFDIPEGMEALLYMARTWRFGSHPIDQGYNLDDDESDEEGSDFDYREIYQELDPFDIKLTPYTPRLEDDKVRLNASLFVRITDEHGKLLVTANQRLPKTEVVLRRLRVGRIEQTKKSAQADLAALG